MLMAYLFSGLIVSAIAAFLFLISGGSLMMAFVIYTVTGSLMAAVLAVATALKSRPTT